MKSLLILILFISTSKIDFGQRSEIDTFFSQFENGFYKDLTKAKFFIVDRVVDLSDMDFKELYGNDTSLTTDDVDIIAKSVKKKTKQVWTNQTFDSATIKSEKKMQEKVRSTQTKTSSIAYFQLSLPYFNRAKDVCFIYCSFYCGRHCYESCYRLYKKINGYWTLINKYGCVVS